MVINKRKEDNCYHRSLEYILEDIKMESPMLALQIKNKSDEIQNEIWNNQDRWLAEEKIDGCRMNLCWFKEDNALDAYSRNTSVNDFLPINYLTIIYLSVTYKSMLKSPNNVNEFVDFFF